MTLGEFRRKINALSLYGNADYELVRECDFGGDWLETAPIRNFRVLIKEKQIILTSSDKSGEPIVFGAEV